MTWLWQFWQLLARNGYTLRISNKNACQNSVALYLWDKYLASTQNFHGQFRLFVYGGVYKNVKSFIVLSSCENFLFSWISLINTIVLMCNMAMLWSKLKKLWAIQYLQNSLENASMSFRFGWQMLQLILWNGSWNLNIFFFQKEFFYHFDAKSPVIADRGGGRGPPNFFYTRNTD